MLETMKVSSPLYEGGFLVIAKKDFDPNTMTEFGTVTEVADEPEVPAVKVAPKSKRG